MDHRHLSLVDGEPADSDGHAGRPYRASPPALHRAVCLWRRIGAGGDVANRTGTDRCSGADGRGRGHGHALHPRDHPSDVQGRYGARHSHGIWGLWHQPVPHWGRSPAAHYWSTSGGARSSGERAGSDARYSSSLFHGATSCRARRRRPEASAGIAPDGGADGHGVRHQNGTQE